MKYRKKPLVVEAFRPNIDPAPEWANSPNVHLFNSTPRSMSGAVVLTREGDRIVAAGDWIIKGVEGELYPCNASVFEKTYDLVEEV